MSWNKTTCDTCKEAVTPKEVIRSSKNKVSTYKICPKCSFPMTSLAKQNSDEIEQTIITGMTKRSHLRYPDERHISNIAIPKYMGHQHFIRQAELLASIG